jgi:hypothetical protein
MENVSIEFGLLALTHNLAKLAKIQPFDNIIPLLFQWIQSTKSKIVIADRY